MSRTHSQTIAIIGGGFTGAAFAVHFLKRHQGPGAKLAPVKLIIFEPRPLLGQGLAYSAEDQNHRINVPATRMTLYPEKPDDFQNYLQRQDLSADQAMIGRDGNFYPARQQFGAYVAGEMAPLLENGQLQHVQARAVKINRQNGRYEIEAENGSLWQADRIVLAATHPAPDLPRELKPFAAHERLIADATKPGILRLAEAGDAARIAVDDDILIIGAGLTAADVVASLKAQGHKGHITCISRRGLRSRGHPIQAQEPFGDFTSKPPNKASALVHQIRTTIREAEQQGLSWHAVLDAVRLNAFGLWQALGLEGQRRIVRLARPFWDAHRFRIAPQLEAVLDKAVEDKSLSLHAARLAQVEAVGNGFSIDLKVKNAGTCTLYVQRIIVTTGPAHGRIIEGQPVLQSLAQQGLITLCPTGLGLATDLNAHAVNAIGVSQETLFIAGPLARGTFGELMGLPQVTEHAIYVADKVAESLL